MPYHNMPASMWPKMDKCVNDVQATGKDKQAAIAICYTSLMGKSMETEFKASDQPGDYLIVEDREKPTTWHLQVRDNGTPDHRLMGAAWAALHGGYRGNVYEGPNKQEAIGKLRKLYESEGMTVPSEKAQKDFVESVMNAAKAFVQNLFGQSEPEPVEHIPTAPEPFTLFKDAKGQWYWKAIATNNRRDSDHPAQILTSAAHREFVDYLDAHPEAMPELWHWHTPGTKWGKATVADYVDGFVVYAGTIDAGHEAEAEKLAQAKEIGVSHGFVVLDHDVEQEHIKKYRTFEISPLPLSAAANRWTQFSAIHKEVGMPFAEQKRAYLVGLLGEERVKMLESDLSAANKTLDALGIEQKEETPAEKAEASAKAFGDRIKEEVKEEIKAEAEKPTAEKKEEGAWFLSDMKPEEFKTLLSEQVKPMLESQQQANVTAIVTATKEVGDSLTKELEKIVKAQSDLDKRLKELEGLTPRAYRASQDPATAVAKDKAEKAAPGPDQKANEFLSFVMGQFAQ